MMRVRTKTGTTLSETLAAVLIMSLVTLAIAAGVTTGSRVYTRIRMKAEGQAILSTNVAALSDYLEKGYGISSADGSSIAIQFSEVSNSGIRIYNNGSAGIYIQYTNNDGNIIDNTEPQPLISDKDNTSGLYAELSDAVVESGTENPVTSYKITIKDKSGKTYDEADKVSVRSMIHYPADQAGN